VTAVADADDAAATALVGRTSGKAKRAFEAPARRAERLGTGNTESDLGSGT
jgi:hypothetical protein